MIDPLKDDNDAKSFRDGISDISLSRFGLHEKEFELNYVYDVMTVSKILRDIVRIHGLGVNAVEVDAHGRFGFLRLGDVISLTSDRLHLTDHTCQIVSKTWNGGRWRYIVHIEENIFVNNRSVK